MKICADCGDLGAGRMCRCGGPMCDWDGARRWSFERAASVALAMLAMLCALLLWSVLMGGGS